MENSLEKASSNRMLEALEYARIGWAVIPVHIPGPKFSCSCKNPNCQSNGKHPRTPNGSKDATIDPIIICKWWSMWPEANIGIATGSASGIVVIDIDPRHGGDASWERFALGQHLPPTLTSLTGGGGRHLIYRCTDKAIPNKVNILPGVDIRGEGGYIVAPPSLHYSGDIYDWKEGFEVDQIAELPKAVEDLIFQPQSKVIPFTGKRIPNGSRNSTLTSLAGLLRRQGLEEDGIREALGSLNQTLCQPPLDPSEVGTIAKSIFLILRTFSKNLFKAMI